MRTEGGGSHSHWRTGDGTEGKCACGERPPLGYHTVSMRVIEMNSVQFESINLRLGLLHGLVSDDEVVKKISRLVNCLN